MSSQDLSKLKIGLDAKSVQGRRRRKKVWWVGVLAVLALVLLYLGVSGKLTPPTEIYVTKAAVTYASRALTNLNASGYVVAQRKAAVSSKATGRLQNLYVEEGKIVKLGDLLANLENDDLQANLDEGKAALLVARANLANAAAELDDATINFNRQKTLRESGSVSIQAFDTAEARYKKAVAMERSARFAVERAQATVKVAEVNLEYSLIRAPFDGVVLTKNADVGEVVAPFGASINSKAAVVTMADMSSLMVEVDVAESSIEKVKIGQATEIRLDAFPNDRFPGTVHMIVPTADRAKATVMTKVKFDKPASKTLPEMSAKVAFLSRPLKDDEKAPFIGVPASAVKDKNGWKVVYRISSQRAREAPIKVGRMWDETAEVTKGLQEGDVIALDPSKLSDGQRIAVKE
jgi:RND family efflux transporter MFP subunit